MKDEQEAELKLALDGPEELDLVLARLPAPLEVVEQRNHYFTDPEGLLARGRITVRVREERRLDAREATRIFLTVKWGKTRQPDGYFAATELEERLDAELWRSVQGGRADLADLRTAVIARLRARAPIASLALEGSTTNVRHRVELEGYLLELDRTTFPGGRVDAEIEVETSDPSGARALLDRLAAASGVTLRPQKSTKYARFRRILKNG